MYFFADNVVLKHALLQTLSISYKHSPLCQNFAMGGSFSKKLFPLKFNIHPKLTNVINHYFENCFTHKFEAALL